MKKKIRLELTVAIIIASALSALAVYMNQPTQTTEIFVNTRGMASSGEAASLRSLYGLGSTSTVQETISENIRGELRKDTFETVVEGLKNLTFVYGGLVPYLTMAYENDAWSGSMTCSVPTDNVTEFTFGARHLINDNGKVTYISQTVTETIVNQTALAQNQFSDVTIGLTEPAQGGSPVLAEIGLVMPWLTTGLVWIAQGLIIGVPLCFVSLAIVMLADRAIIPAWKKQLKNKDLRRPTSSTRGQTGVQSE
jgi:hypothetical protein